MIKTHQGVDYIIFKSSIDEIMSFFTAYVKVPTGHPWTKHLKRKRANVLIKLSVRGYDAIPLEVHGGLTFGELIKKGQETHQGFSPGWWIGWDYAHVGDAIYPEGDELVSPTLQELRQKKPELFSNRDFGFGTDHRWTYGEVEIHVFDAINQLIESK